MQEMGMTARAQLRAGAASRVLAHRLLQWHNLAPLLKQQSQRPMAGQRLGQRLLCPVQQLPVQRGSSGRQWNDSAGPHRSRRRRQQQQE